MNRNSSPRTSGSAHRRRASAPARLPAAAAPSRWPELPADSLAYALDGAARAVEAVRAGTSLPAALAALEAQRGNSMPAAARGAIHDLAYRTMRALALADAIVAELVPRAPVAPTRGLLVCALALLADEATPRAAYPAFTVVDQAVQATGAQREPAVAATKGLVNAVLRNFLRSREACLERARQEPAARWNYPDWWIKATRAAWPDDWQRILEVGNTRAPLTLRVNRRQASVGDYLRTLSAAGIEATLAGADAVRLTQPLPIEAIPGFAAGVVSVQDAGAQRAAPLLNVRDGMRVLDACAAPGGKTGHLLELADIELLALDSDAVRSRRIEDNLHRLGLRAGIAIGDAGEPQAWWDGRPFERILADVPCSASGIVRRHPDIRWLRRASDIEALAERQRRILDALWPLLAPGGELLYVTCSIFPQEGEAQASWFERSRQDAVRLDAPGQLLPSVCDDGTASAPDQDGFFYARFLKHR